MKLLQLTDLTRDELLAWIERDVLPRCWPNGGLIRQADLLSVRHAAASKRAQLLDEAAVQARIAERIAFDAYIGEQRPRQRAEREIAWIDAKAETIFRRQAADASDAKAQAWWAALEAAWEAERA